MHLVFTIGQIISDKNLPGHGGGNATEATIKTVLQIIFVTLGALCVLMIVIAGIRYMTAAGEPAKVTQAKNTILYSLIGLVIAASAWAIVDLAIKTL
jgi:hypothetical protein